MSASESRPAKPSWFTSIFSEERDSTVLGLLRASLSVLLFLNTARLFQELQQGGFFGDFFHIPIVPEALVPTRTLYVMLLSVQALGALLGFLGLWSRGALLLTSSIGLFLLCCDRLQYHNNRYALLLLGLLLAFTPCDRSFSIARRGARALPASERRAPTFARRLLQIQVSLVYFSSACGKLFDPDWRGGQVLHLRFTSVAPFWASHGHQLPASAELLLSSMLLATLAAKVAIASELFLALGLWFPHTRRLALWVGVLFHFSIEVSARVELFSWVMGASYLAFVVPELRQRRLEYDPERALGRVLARGLRWLDWCARFEITPTKTDLNADTFSVLGRDGKPRQGLARFALLAEATPLLFPLWPPLLLAAKLERALKRA